MNRNKLRYMFSLLLLTIGMPLFAQGKETADMADLMRSNGKIYVVVAVVVIIFIGFLIYLITLDRKISKLEKEIKELEK